MSKPRTRIEKGKRAEKEVARRIEVAGLGKARREAGSGNGKMKADISCNLPFLIEVKNQKTIKYIDWVEQSKKQAEIGNFDGNKWCLIIVNPKGVQDPERMEMYATIELDEFLSLLKKNSEPKIKEPDRELKWKLEKLKDYCRFIEKNPADIYWAKRVKLLTTQIMKEL